MDFLTDSSPTAFVGEKNVSNTGFSSGTIQPFHYLRVLTQLKKEGNDIQRTSHNHTNVFLPQAVHQLALHSFPLPMLGA